MSLDSSATSSKSHPTDTSVFSGWNDAYAAFVGAFDNPVARRHREDEYAIDARWRMREFAETMYRVQNPVSLNTNEIEDIVRQTGLGNGMYWPSGTTDFVREIIRTYCAKNKLPFPTNG